MSLYYLDPEREPRECHVCDGTGSYSSHECGVLRSAECGYCNGTGRLGVEGAEPDFEVRWNPHNNRHDENAPGWRWSDLQGYAHHPSLWSEAFPTESAALEAARAAHKTR